MKFVIVILFAIIIISLFEINHRFSKIGVNQISFCERLNEIEGDLYINETDCR